MRLALFQLSLELLLKGLILLLFLDALLYEVEELVFLRLQFALLITNSVNGVCQLLLKGLGLTTLIVQLGMETRREVCFLPVLEDLKFFKACNKLSVV